MRRRVVAVVTGLVLAGVAGPGVGQAVDRTVTVQLFQFRPGELDVAAGTTVTVANQDDIPHTATSGTPERPDGRFDVSLGGRGASGRIALADAGVYPYFCRRHPSMRGEIRVR